MKKYLFSIIFLLVSYVGFSQKGLSYQAVILDPTAIEVPGQDITGQPLVNGDVWMKFSIYNGSTLQFEEVQKTKTDAYGLVNLMIGSVSTASFNSLTWDGVQKSLQVFVSFNQGASYTKVSDQKLNYNPYALYAETAGKLGSVLSIAGGGTGATTAAGARASLGLGNVENTSDAEKPISSATKAALDLKVNSSDVTTALALKANSADVNSALAAKVDSAFVLAKVAAATIADADATTKGKIQLAGDLGGTAAAPTVPGLALKANTADVNTSLDTKVDKVTGKDLSSNDYTTAEKDKLAAITGTNTGDQLNITGNAATATKLATAKNINGVAFDGSADITVTTDAGTLTGTTLASNVVNSSLTSVGTLTSGTISLTTDIVTSGNLKAGAITYPNTAGTNGQVLTSNGAGNATWLSPTSVSVGTISNTSNANGATITSGVLNLTPADETNGGVVTTGTQSFAGLKTFNDGINYIKVSSSSTLDQSNSSSITGSSLGRSFWQSFTAGISGILSSVEWEIEGLRTSITVKIYNGEGINGTLLGTANGMTSTTRSFVAFDLSSSNIKVIASQKYTIQVTTSLNIFSSINSSNPYADGRSSNDPNSDFLFKTNVKAFSTDSYLPLSGGALTGNLSTSGTLTAGTVTYPSAHGISGQILSTTGSGTLTWTNSTADAGTLTGATLNSTVTGSSLTSVGTLNSATVNGKVIVGASSAAAASAVLEVSSTTQGFLPPRMSGAQRDAISSKVAGLVVWCSNCGSNGELQVFNGATWTNIIGGTASLPLVVGSAYQGGKIAYILQRGDLGYDPNILHGLIAATSDQGQGAIRWHNGSNTTIGTTDYIIGSGLSNTEDIINIQGATSTDYAAGLARAHNGGGYTDWYLPSLVELSILYENRVAVGGFTNDQYWSSSEFDDSMAFPIDFRNGGFPSIKEKRITFYVRAIRAF